MQAMKREPRGQLELQTYAEKVLGSRQWWLVANFGRIMAGPNAGRYVSALATLEALEVVDALVRGEEVPVHLMHRHRSGCYDASSLRMQDGELLMRFADREELA